MRGFGRGFLYLCYLFCTWVVLDAIITFSGMLISEEQETWFSDFYMPDPSLGFRMRPDLKDFHLTWMHGEVSGDYSTDSLGFRNPGRSYRSSHHYFIGDSFTFGAWVAREKTFYGRFEEAIGKSVISLGVGGYGIAQYEVVLQQFVPEADSDKSIYLCLFANDLEQVPDSSFLADYYVRMGWNAALRDASLRDRLSIRRSLTYHAARQIGRLLFGINSYAEAGDGTVLYENRGADKRYFEKNFCVAAERKLVEIVDYCQQRGHKLTVMLFPSKEAVYSEEYERLFEDTNYLAIERDGFARVEQLVADLGVPVYNLTELFRRHRSERLFFQHDPHCNERGHELVAEFLQSLESGSHLDTLPTKD